MTASRTPVDADDYLAIMRLANAYANAVIDRDVDSWAACWADDGVWDLGGGRAVSGKESIVAFWNGAMSAFSKVVQTVHTGDAWHRGESGLASGRWNISERFALSDGKTGMLLAHYNDDYRKVNGAWLYTKRELVAHYQGPADLSGKFL